MVPGCLVEATCNAMSEAEDCCQLAITTPPKKNKKTGLGHPGCITLLFPSGGSPRLDNFTAYAP